MATALKDCYDFKFCSDVGRALARHKHYDKPEEGRAGARPTPPKPWRCETFSAMARLLANRLGASSFARFDAHVPGAA